MLVYYFPASGDLVREAVENMLNGSLAFGVLAFVGMVLGANGLFMAANRSVNRVFGIEARRVLQITVTEMVIATSVALLFPLSLGLTVLLDVAVSFGEGILEVIGDISIVSIVVFGVVSTVTPMVLTVAVFAVVYRRLPNAEVEWRDAAFGAMVAVVLFESGKHLFLLVYELFQPAECRLRAGRLCGRPDDVGLHCQPDIPVRGSPDQSGRTASTTRSCAGSPVFVNMTFTPMHPGDATGDIESMPYHSPLLTEPAMNALPSE